MNRQHRIEVIRAMDLLARCVNDEDVFDYWLAHGLPDGAVESGSEEEYIDDKTFAELLTAFVELMDSAGLHLSGALHCDGVVSK